MGHLKGKNVLLLAPGSTMTTHRQEVVDFINTEKPVVISVNFIPDGIKPDYAFFSNNKRYDKINNFPCKTIVTSNVSNEKADYVIDYNSLTGAFNLGLNSLIMVLKLLKDMEVETIIAAGADGYKESGENYYSNNIRSYTEHGNKFNIAVVDAIHSLDVPVKFLTPSAYKLL